MRTGRLQAVLARMREGTAAQLGFVVQVARCLLPFKITAIPLIFTSLALIIPAQSKELLRILFEEPLQNIHHMIALVLAIALHMLANWNQTYVDAWEILRTKKLHERSVVFVSWTPYLASAAPPLSLAFALWDASRDFYYGLPFFNALYAFVAALAIILLTAVLTSSLPHLPSPAVGGASTLPPAPPSVSKTTWRYVLGLGAILISSTWLSTDFCIEFALIIGPLSIVYCFSLCVLFLLAAIKRAHARLQSAFSIGMLVYLIPFFLMKTVHESPVASGERRSAIELSVDEGFRQWFDRTASEKNLGLRTVILVSTQGGGAYAAYHAAYTLATLQDGDPKFKSQLFAISSVSGGALGAAIFVEFTRHLPALLARYACERSSESAPQQSHVASHVYRLATDLFFQHDLFSPLVAGALLRDLPSSLFLFNVLAEDRSEVFARGIERAFASTLEQIAVRLQACGEARAVKSTGVQRDQFSLKSDLAAQWAQTMATPAVIFNTTRVDNGGVIALAPFKFGREREWLQGHADINPMIEVSTRLAIASSARFPLLNSAGAFSSKSDAFPDKVQIVDGGYFENSGLTTLVELLRIINPRPAPAGEDPNMAATHGQAKPANLRFQVLAIVSSEPTEEAPQLSGWLSTPSRAFLNSRDARARQALDGVRALEAQSDDKSISLSIGSIRPRSLNLPLGWQLSEEAKRRIRCTVANDPLGLATTGNMITIQCDPRWRQ